jgi:excisionase family DNA binding protein
VPKDGLVDQPCPTDKTTPTEIHSPSCIDSANDPGQEVRVARARLLYSPAEAAEVLGIGRTKVFALVGAGTLFSIRIGVLRRIPVTAVDAYLADLKVTEDEAGPASINREEG